jgi:hypothetical protein
VQIIIYLDTQLHKAAQTVHTGGCGCALKIAFLALSFHFLAQFSSVLFHAKIFLVFQFSIWFFTKNILFSCVQIKIWAQKRRKEEHLRVMPDPIQLQSHSTYFRSAAQDPQSCHLGIPGNSMLNLKTEIQQTTIDCVLHYFIISLEDQKMRIEEKTSRRAGTFPDRGIRR